MVWNVYVCFKESVRTSLSEFLLSFISPLLIHYTVLHSFQTCFLYLANCIFFGQLCIFFSYKAVAAAAVTDNNDEITT